uniref:CCHC-type domain-containing protein n=1 Tax=Fagus sylvatica TaxID=28930 RepID=A0A2N9FF63_FAGSY
MLHHMKDNIIPLFERKDNAKDMMDALETKYGCRSDTQIQLLLDKFNNIKMNEGDIVGDHVNQLELIAKELADVGHTLSDKMQVIVVLNSLPPSWDHVVTSLTHSGKELAMTTLPQFKPKYKFKHKRFKKQWTRKPRQENKPRDACYQCGEREHYKINCPLNKRPKNKGKEIFMTIIEALVIESPPTSWWIDSTTTRHIVRNRELFVDLKEKQLGEHRVYMGNNTYSDVLREAHVLIPKPLRNKLIDKTWECKFIGYVENGSGYRFFHSDKGLIESRDAVFIEDTKLITPLEQIKKLLYAESEESDPHVSVFFYKDLENSGRKRTSPEPVMTSIDADDSGRKRQRRPSSMLKDYYLMESKAVAIEDDLANFAKANGKLVAKGFTQQPGVDFVDTYSPVAKFASVRIIMVVAAKLDLELHQLDVKTTFLNEDLKEEIYMDQPDGFQIKGQEGKVLKRFKMEDCRPVSSPVSKGMILNKSMCPTNKIELEEMIAVPYAQTMGNLIYAMTSTKPDICYAVGLVSKYQSNPGKAHWQAVKRIFRYLQMTKSMKLCFGLDELEIKGFTDADFARDTDDKKSTSGYVFLFGGTMVSWLSKKQNCVAKYTMEAEYIACSIVVGNVVWTKRFVDSLKLDMQDRPVNVFCDNKSAISLIKSRANSLKGKHIDVNYHYIQDIVEMREIKVHFVPSANKMADPMTKGLTLNQFRMHVTGMRLRGNSVELHGSARLDGPEDA